MTETLEQRAVALRQAGQTISAIVLLLGVPFSRVRELLGEDQILPGDWRDEARAASMALADRCRAVGRFQ